MLLGLLLLAGCDSQETRLEDARALLTIDGRQMEATAVLVTRALEGNPRQSVMMETASHQKVEILGSSFDAGSFTVSFQGDDGYPYVVSYQDATEPPSLFIASSGTLRIDRAADDRVEGSFTSETTDAFSNCLSCDEARGPAVSGTFKALRVVQ